MPVSIKNNVIVSICLNATVANSAAFHVSETQFNQRGACPGNCRAPKISFSNRRSRKRNSTAFGVTNLHFTKRHCFVTFPAF